MREGLAATAGAVTGLVIGGYCGWHIPDPWTHADAVGVEYPGLRLLFAYVGMLVLAPTVAVQAVKAQV